MLKIFPLLNYTVAIRKNLILPGSHWKNNLVTCIALNYYQMITTINSSLTFQSFGEVAIALNLFIFTQAKKVDGKPNLWMHERILIFW